MSEKIIAERYLLKKYLGGGMSSVYLAQDIILYREVVVKLIKADPYNKEKTMERFQREVQNVTKLSHPNIVTVLDVDDSDEYNILVTEYVDGSNLKQYINENNPIDFEKIIELSISVLSGIEHAHNRGIVHRDIKPQNILIDKKGNIKITDFGIAKAMSETRLTETNQVMGSVQYISPEQAKGKSADERADIYSFGIMLFELITGKLPFQSETQVSVALQHIQDDMPNINDYRETPLGLENIVLKCTEKEPENRYSNVREVINALLNYRNETIHYLQKGRKKPERIITPTPLPLKEDTSKEEVKKKGPLVAPVKDEAKKKKRHIWPWILFMLLVVVSIATVIYLLWPKDPKTVELVDLSEMSQKDAEQKLTELNLVLGDVSEEYNDDFDEGNVIASAPKKGAVLEEGASVDLVVSKGPEPYSMADFVGSNIDEIQADIDALNFDKLNIETKYSNEVPKGVIMDQSIRSGVSIFPENEVLTLTVSDGVEPVEISSYVGWQLSDARSELESFGFEVNIINEIYSDDVANGAIVSQDPSYGSFLPGSPINLIVSKGSEPKEITQYQLNVEIPYSSSKKDKKPSKVKIYIEDKDHDYDDVLEEFEITEDRKHTITLALEKNETGKYKVEVDGKKIIEKEVEND
ncbi:Stk1 family PASTA domain-containing Ser/Thr kinase [Phocicoccus pinnipedialis]|uniref:non-specific serine/threonine protein kinase n=1 Tax=Phocicoccus pinnipedialis TaxID=110845 RepID=A0A6V7RHY6_9BACL|nr:Stk1 family PASTA domain-containing Ser/Thr kinase [Jeotgalicoccus pinnipedialis]MBP1939067.1 serine/threonine-protein kinase [Jeotgalicoccus pinnipedialis]CAD2076943.1 Serine/threonine-protein kinase PrkC [Jeotgalicoccus pinnipedialis]